MNGRREMYGLQQRIQHGVFAKLIRSVDAYVDQQCDGRVFSRQWWALLDRGRRGGDATGVGTVRWMVKQELETR
jgi:hypothetical protein